MAFWGEDSDAKTSAIWGGVIIVVTAIFCYTWVLVD